MIGERLKKLRLKNGYTLTDLAEISGVSKSYLSYIERNLQTNPSLQLLTKLTDPLNTTIEELLSTNHTKEGQTIEDDLDEEWKEILQQAISKGMNKEEFKSIRDYFEYRKQKNSIDNNR